MFLILSQKNPEFKLKIPNGFVVIQSSAACEFMKSCQIM